MSLLFVFIYLLIHYNGSQRGPANVWLPTLFRISSMFHNFKIFIFGWTIHFKSCFRDIFKHAVGSDMLRTNLGKLLTFKVQSCIRWQPWHRVAAGIQRWMMTPVPTAWMRPVHSNDHRSLFPQQTWVNTLSYAWTHLGPFSQTCPAL